MAWLNYDSSFSGALILALHVLFASFAGSF